MSKASNLSKKTKKTLKEIYQKIPIEPYAENGYLGVKNKSTKFNPTKPDIKDKIFLVKLDGNDTSVIEVNKKGDDLMLEWDDKVCAITSKPLVVGGNHFYFTRDGFLGTMALNKDTLLAGDVFKPSKEQIKRKLPKDIDYEDHGINLKEYDFKEHEDHYEVSVDSMGDVIALAGSKKTLKEMNKAKRIRKLLEPSGIDRTKALGLIGIGVVIGIYAYPNVIAV